MLAPHIKQEKVTAMRSGTLSVVLGVLFLAGSPNAQTLEQTAGPPGATFGGVTERNGEIFANGGGGVYIRSGEEWSFLPVATPLGRLFVVGETLFSDRDDLYRSDDGETWQRAFEGPNLSVTFTADSVLVFKNDSLFISSDGLEWRNVITGRQVVDEGGTPTGEQLPQLGSAVRTPDGKTWVTALAFSGIFFSEDGAAWHEETDGIPEFSIISSLFATTTGVLIAQTGGSSGFYQFDHTAQVWVERPIELPPATGVRKLVEAQGEVYALARSPSTITSFLYRLDGTEWTEITLPEQDVREVAASEDGLYALTPGGLYEKVGTGAWAPLHEGLVATSAMPFGLSDDVVAFVPGGWMKTTDEGATWQSVDFPEGVYRIYDTEGGVVVGTTGDGVYRSLDAGDTWQPANTGIDVPVFYQVNLRHVAARSGTIYGGLYTSRRIVHDGGGTLGGVYRSTNDAQSWAPYGSGYPVNEDGNPAGVYRLGVTENHLFAWTQEGLYRIPHTGGVWEFLDTPTDGIAFAIESDGSRVILITFHDTIVSEDEGETWSSLAEGLPDGTYRKTLAEHDGEIYLLIHPIPDLEPVSGLFTLGESVWEDTGVEIPEWVRWNSLIGQGEDLFLGSTNHGVWRVNDFIIGTDSPEAPTDGASLSVFPNPARRDAAVSLTLPSASDVQLELFDVTGRRVATLHAGELAAQTGHRFDVDASKLAPGVYVVRLSAARLRVARGQVPAQAGAEGDGVRLNRTFTVVR